MASEKEIREHAEQLYHEMIANFHEKSAFAKLYNDSEQCDKYANVSVANLRNILIGGTLTGEATWNELMEARAWFDTSNYNVQYSLTVNAGEGHSPMKLTKPKKVPIESIIEPLRRSIWLLITRVWDRDTQERYLSRQTTNDLSPDNVIRSLLPDAVVRALCGTPRLKRVHLSQLSLPIEVRISLLDECVRLCNTRYDMTKHKYTPITEVIAKCAWDRIKGDPKGKLRADVNIHAVTNGFPQAMKEEIGRNGFIDEWAIEVNYDATKQTTHHNHKNDDSTANATNCPTVRYQTFTYGNEPNQKFWFMVIDNAFSDPFWATFAKGLDNLRFCAGLGGKENAYVRCSSFERDSVFSTAGKFRYQTMIPEEIEMMVMSFAEFIMTYQRAFVERLIGKDYIVKFGCNVLHMIVAAITRAVYDWHSDAGPLLCALQERINVHKDVFLPEQSEMQVLTLYYSNAAPLEGDAVTQMSFRYGSKETGYEILGHETLGARGIHIQGPGSQSPMVQHCTTPLPILSQSGVFRCICTTRLSIVPRHGARYMEREQLQYGKLSGIEKVKTRTEADHVEVNVVQKLCHTNKPISGNTTNISPHPITTFVDKASLPESASETSSPEFGKRKCDGVVTCPTQEVTTKKPKRYQRSQTETYGKVSQNDYDNHYLPKYTPRVAFLGRTAQLTRGRAILHLLRKGILVYVRTQDGSIIPCLHEDGNKLLQLGQLYSLDKICMDACITHNPRCHPPIGTSVNSSNVIILTKRYKQRPFLLDGVSATAKSFSDNPNDTTIEYTEPFLGGLEVLGSGGCHRVQGSYPPRPRYSNKDDAYIEVGIGQNIDADVNQKLQEVAVAKAPQAVFGNEKHCLPKGVAVDHNDGKSIRFYGYFYMPDFVIRGGDDYDDVLAEFGNPSKAELENLTFRGDTYTALIGKPLVPTLKELRELVGDREHIFQKIILDYNDDSPLYYYYNKDNWSEISRSLTVENVIDQMIETKEIEQLLWLDDTGVSPTRVFSVEATEKVMCYNCGYVTDQHLLTLLCGQCGHDISYHSLVSENNDVSPHIAVVPSGRKSCRYKISRPPSTGTPASIADIVNCCIFMSAAAAMRYNRKSLVEQEDGSYLAGPLKDPSIGSVLRGRPAPAPNRCADVISCYQRNLFNEHSSLNAFISSSERCTVPKKDIIPSTGINHSISCKVRCAVTESDRVAIKEMLFQIVVLRFTGRIYRFEFYRHKINDYRGRLSNGKLVDVSNIQPFLSHVQDCNVSGIGMNRWISKQHDGAISLHLHNNVANFSKFVNTVAEGIGEVMKLMQGISEDDQITDKRGTCTDKLSAFLTTAMSNAGCTVYGNAKWMAHVCLADLEEFFEDPFGPIIADTSIPFGSYSYCGYQMAQLAHSKDLTMNAFFNNIVKYVHIDVAAEHLMILGYKKINGEVLNVFNQRRFSLVDAEHFSCKTWLYARLAMGHAQRSRYPEQCSAHTHPSPTLHRQSNPIIDDIMEGMEKAYNDCQNSSDLNLILPELVALTGDIPGRRRVYNDG